ncbi:hypothetical protein TGAM01_v209975 [Trichoderma gamsii]|uniref:Stress-response A/B barrel domain-containing protein n=1 Tax=Trichoderma gamsii TaxID=398673 RepID=A0A2K0TH64_9HYPO|nr:hypothetical protein TGAM01_v209975 [Trichoderma gamsii]PNP44869.1 hypothetical protein TGAMA5MH_03282 [Trichoderma gamsii]PON21127.1 hypothetical protein TGAM01_v209975 [Trichoderma gamsii]
MAQRVHRVTMFKLPNKEHQEKLLALYKTVRDTSTKDGKPYILSMAVGACEPDQRSQGYDFAAKFEFASLEDMRFYDDECPAHQALKAAARDLDVGGLMTIYFKELLTGGI